jgi:hypothetical protein
MLRSNIPWSNDQLIVQKSYEVTSVEDSSNVGLLSNITYVTK